MNELTSEIMLLLDQAENAESKIKGHVIDSLGIFYTIQTSFLIADRLPLSLDMRADYWRRYDRLLFAAYYQRFVFKKFAPVDEMTDYLLALARVLESANNGQIISINWNETESGWFQKQCSRFSAVPRLLKTSFTPVKLGQNPIFEDYDHPADHFEEWLAEISSNDDPKVCNTAFQYRISALPFLLAKKPEDLATETLRVLAWDCLFTSTNAYQQGGAQGFAPFLGNDHTMRFLDAVRAWKNGKTLNDYPLMFLGGSGNDRKDLSDYSAIKELYGFINLQRAPFLNKVSEDNFKAWLKIPHEHIMADEIGTRFRQALEGNAALCQRMAKLFDALKAEVQIPNVRLRDMQTVAGKKTQSLFDHSQCLIHGVDQEYKNTFQSINWQWNNLEKSIALSHLLFDSRFFLEKAAKEQLDSAPSDMTTMPLKTGWDSIRESSSDPSNRARSSSGGIRGSKGGSIENILNRIFYGPPGTGKTYRCFSEAVRIIDGDRSPTSRQEIKARYMELRSQGRIEFVTFHQNYSYEDFVEGLRPETDENQQLKYMVRPGILKTFVQQEGSREWSRIHDMVSASSSLWRVSLGSTSHRDYCFETESIGLNYDVPYDLKDAEMESFFKDKQLKKGKAILEKFRDEVKIGDVVCIFKDASSIQAVGVVTGGYFFQKQTEGFVHRRKVDWLDKNTHSISDINDGKAMTTQALHRLARISTRQLFERINLVGGTASQNEPSVLIIDEINRGNLSKIMGELISLLEPDKRQGMDNEISVRLPYSGEIFALPANIHILGTMNTSDRSIALMDFAMRRRFHFTYIPPNSLMVPESVDGIELRRFFGNLNAKIRESIGRDYELGHGIFMNLYNKSEIYGVLRNQVVPLLREYFYDDERKLKEALPWIFEDAWLKFECHEIAEPEIVL